MRHFSLTLVAALAVGLLAANHASAVDPVLLNGSFESPTVPSGSVTPGGGDFWTPSDPVGVFIISNGNGIGDTSFGMQFLGLNGQSAGNMFESDSQTIANFQAGVTYVLSVDFADALGGPDPILTIALSGVFTGSQDYTAPIGGPYGSGTFPFTSALFSFTPTVSGSETITLMNSGINSAIAVDNVTLSVPEPTSMASLLFGAGALGAFVIFRRSRRQSV